MKVHRLCLLAALTSIGFACSDAQPREGRVAKAPDAPASSEKSEDSKTQTPGKKDAPASPAATPSGNTPPANNAPIPAGPTSNEIRVAAGPVTFDLAVPRPALSGAQVTGNLIINPAAPGVPASITLEAIAVKGATTTGLVLYRPVLVAQKAGSAEEIFPIGTNINQRVAQSRLMPLAQQSITVSGVQAGDALRIRFSALEPLAQAENSGIASYRECKAPQNFQAMATALQPCKACHSGLFNYDFMGRDNATACGLNLKLIDLTLAPSGALPNLLRPTTAGHPATTTTGYSQALSTWRAGEGL